MNEKLYIGSGAEFKFNAYFKTDQGDEPWDVTAVAGRKILAVIKTSKANVLASFTYGIDDDDTIEVLNASEGEYVIRLNPSVSAKAPAGRSTLEVKIAEPNDDFENQTFMTIGMADLVDFVEAATSHKEL